MDAISFVIYDTIKLKEKCDEADDKNHKGNAVNSLDDCFIKLKPLQLSDHVRFSQLLVEVIQHF